MTGENILVGYNWRGNVDTIIECGKHDYDVSEKALSLLREGCRLFGLVPNWESVKVYRELPDDCRMFRIVRVDGTSIWRNRTQIDEYLRADVIYHDVWGDGVAYCAKL